MMAARSTFVRHFSALFLIGWCGTAAAAPNILLVIADDYGFDKSSLFVSGEDVPPTPTIDWLAAEGVSYDNVWSAPTCSPTRATMITGQHGSRNGISRAITPPAVGLEDRLDYPHFLPRKMSGLGYDTGIVGKWHLTRQPDGPIRAGFDFFVGRPRSFGPAGVTPEEPAAAYWGTYLETYRCAPACEQLTFPEPPAQAPVPEEFHDNYMSTWEVDQALGWISERGDAPWFLWLALQAPHVPLQLPPAHLVDSDLVRRVEGHFGLYEAGRWVQPRQDPEGARLVLGAMISAMDTEIGRLLGAIDLNETVVIFLGDNGTANLLSVPSLVPRGRAKGQIYQGGIHVPMVIAGPGVVNPGRRSDALVHTSDIFSTVLDVAEAEMRSDGVPASIPREIEISGRTVKPILAGDPAPARRYLLTEGATYIGNPAFQDQGRYGGSERTAIRNDRYKLLQSTVRDDNGSFICVDGPQPTADDPVPCGRDERVKAYELYDLANDPRESTDLLADGLDSLAPEIRAIFEELREAVPLVRAGDQ